MIFKKIFLREGDYFPLPLFFLKMVRQFIILLNNLLLLIIFYNEIKEIIIIIIHKKKKIYKKIKIIYY